MVAQARYPVATKVAVLRMAFVREFQTTYPWDRIRFGSAVFPGCQPTPCTFSARFLGDYCNARLATAAVT
jgi:hypothetical protein